MQNKLYTNFSPLNFLVFITALCYHRTVINPRLLSAGSHASEDLGTRSLFGIPGHVERSPSAKAVWKVELVRSSSPELGILNLKVTPPADAPIGEYNLHVKYRGEEMLLAMLVMLFNPWCPGRLNLFYLGY